MCALAVGVLHLALSADLNPHESDPRCRSCCEQHTNTNLSLTQPTNFHIRTQSLYSLDSTSLSAGLPSSPNNWDEDETTKCDSTGLTSGMPSLVLSYENACSHLSKHLAPNLRMTKYPEARAVIMTCHQQSFIPLCPQSGSPRFKRSDGPGQLEECFLRTARLLVNHHEKVQLLQRRVHQGESGLNGSDTGLSRHTSPSNT